MLQLKRSISLEFTIFDTREGTRRGGTGGGSRGEVRGGRYEGGGEGYRGGGLEKTLKYLISGKPSK